MLQNLAVWRLNTAPRPGVSRSSDKPPRGSTLIPGIPATVFAIAAVAAIGSQLVPIHHRPSLEAAIARSASDVLHQRVGKDAYRAYGADLKHTLTQFDDEQREEIFGVIAEIVAPMLE